MERQTYLPADVTNQIKEDLATKMTYINVTIHPKVQLDNAEKHKGIFLAPGLTKRAIVA